MNVSVKLYSFAALKFSRFRQASIKITLFICLCYIFSTSTRLKTFYIPIGTYYFLFDNTKVLIFHNKQQSRLYFYRKFTSQSKKVVLRQIA